MPRLQQYSVLSSVAHTNLAALMLVCAVRYFVQYPPSQHTYDFGGISACISGFISSFVAFLFFAAHVLYFSQYSKPQTVRHRQYELAFALFVWSLAFGGMVFALIEGWDFDRGVQFTASTMLTIGYGDLAPKTVAGRIITILYFLFAFLILKYFFVSFEDIVIDETVKVS